MSHFDETLPEQHNLSVRAHKIDNNLVTMNEWLINLNETFEHTKQTKEFYERMSKKLTESRLRKKGNKLLIFLLKLDILVQKPQTYLR